MPLVIDPLIRASLQLSRSADPKFLRDTPPLSPLSSKAISGTGGEGDQVNASRAPDEPWRALWSQSKATPLPKERLPCARGQEPGRGKRRHNPSPPPLQGFRRFPPRVSSASVPGRRGRLLPRSSRPRALPPSPTMHHLPRHASWVITIVPIRWSNKSGTVPAPSSSLFAPT